MLSLFEEVKNITINIIAPGESLNQHQQAFVMETKLKQYNNQLDFKLHIL